MNVYHYTTSDKLRLIDECGLLMPSSIKIGENEKPVVWFSSNPMWEPTANKSLGYRDAVRGLDVSIRPLTTPEMNRMFTLIRLCIDRDKVLPWHQLRKAANIAHTEQRRLIRRARRVGASPVQWFGSLEPIPIDDLTIQVLSPARKWIAHLTEETPCK